MDTQPFNTRLTTLFNDHKRNLNLIQRLSKFPTQPGSSPLKPEGGDPRVELSAEIHQNLKDQEEDFELLRQEIEDQTNNPSWVNTSRRGESKRDSERTALAAQVTRLGEDLKLARTHFRKAQLQAKRNAEIAKRKEREILFEGIQDGSNTTGQGRRRGQEKLTQDELLLNASNDVTAALRRTHSLMQAEVSRSQFANETLQQSTAALSTLSESYSNLDTLLSSSRSLVSSLLHSQKSDTWYLESAFWILVTTISWLVFRRLLYGPAWWLLYLPTRLLWNSTFALAHALVGVSAAIIGTPQSASQSRAMSEPSASLITKPSATGGIPKFSIEMSAPSINVGGGGSGAKDMQHKAAKPEGKSVTEEIDKMAEVNREEAQGREASRESSQGGTILRERNSDEPPNPKKRMWEEGSNSPHQGDQPRDEL